MKKYALWLIFALVFALVLGACTRSASGSVPPTPTASGMGGFPTPVPTGVANISATQTAVAMPPQTGGGEAEAQPTPIPLATLMPTATPIPLPTATPKPGVTAAATKVSHEVPAKYTLHEGEFPYCLARRFNIDPDDLLRANGLVRGQTVYPGKTLIIPEGAKPFPYQRALRAHPTTYIVQYGDTLYTIACKFGDVWPEDIAAANGLSLNATLTPGQTLQIP